MGKTTNPKPRLNFTLPTEYKEYIDEWASKESRSTANLIEYIVKTAVDAKREDKLNGFSED